LTSDERQKCIWYNFSVVLNRLNL